MNATLTRDARDRETYLLHIHTHREHPFLVAVLQEDIIGEIIDLTLSEWFSLKDTDDPPINCTISIGR